MLTHFVAYLYKEGLKAGTMKSYLAATRHTRIALVLGNPHIKDMARLEYMIEGVKRLMNGPTRPRLPITLPLLAQLQCTWSANRSNKDASMLWAAATMCFFSFLRAGRLLPFRTLRSTLVFIWQLRTSAWTAIAHLRT